MCTLQVAGTGTNCKLERQWDGSGMGFAVPATPPKKLYCRAPPWWFRYLAHVSIQVREEHPSTPRTTVSGHILSFLSRDG